MKFISEEESSAIVTHELAFAAAREALIAAADGGARVFPAVIAHGSDPGNRFSMKSGVTPDVAGLKVGSYWPSADKLGLPRHNSAILLMDQDAGRLGWVIEGSRVNAFRTAAADAVAADALARKEASVLAVFGAGHQAKYECLALARVRRLKEILVVARDAAKAEAFAQKLRAEGQIASVANAENACARADIVITVTPSRAPLFEAEWIRPGTHVAAMGADGAGKQELPPALFERASLFCDLPSQSVVIGEFQHFNGDRDRIVQIGAVLGKKAPGRTSDDEITIFDSSGIALQDLYVARHLIAAFNR
jgi:ornithine cyclodeaminase